ncbi:MAG: 2-oxoglutarate dehydrogenase complex dihydrolipoyllysine-residue succinyltransferase [Bacteroidetes bacterium]|nr:2-oxoglutarate dehydrogenase complex dihydrolipoyllysine-residue succinyltransferase [Bacteroidota bacterium]
MTIEIKIPSVGESISEVTISKWLKNDGDYVNIDEPIAELESEKATLELNATASGILEIKTTEGNEIKIGETAAIINTDAPKPEPKTKIEKLSDNIHSDNNLKYAEGYPSPAVSKIIEEQNISPALIKGTGKGGRIIKEDIIYLAENKPETIVNENVEIKIPTQIAERSQTIEKMSNLRKSLSRRLVLAKNETAMLTTFNEVNMQPVMDLRNKFKEKFKEKHGVSLGFMSFFTRASVLSLQKFKAVNAYIDGENIIYNNYYDISIAVSGPRGLVVPVIRNAEKLSMAQIENNIATLAAKARDNKLSIEEMTGGTFTISNGGVFGSMLSTPIINPPQSAILGMHNIVERPIAEKGQVVIRPVMYVALSYDHRIIDGRESVGFLLNIKTLLENPQMLLDGTDPATKLLEI